MISTMGFIGRGVATTVSEQMIFLCCICKTPISNYNYSIHEEAYCQVCHTNYQISYNVCDRPYKRLHKRILQKPAPATTTSITTVAQTENFIKNPVNGL